MMGLEMEDDKSWKGKQRSAAKAATRKRGRNGDSKNAQPWLPTSITCDAATAVPGAVECGLILSILVVLIYLYGFYQAATSLPAVPYHRRWSAHLGENLNLARDEWITKPEHSRFLNLAASKRTGKSDEKIVDDVIPAAQWPVSLRNDDKSFETLIHPGDNVTEMNVPKFWLKPIHHGRLMSRETALKIGSCAEPDPVTGSFNRGEDCPVQHRTIFVAIASYRDFECRSTVESVFLRAKHPHRIRVAVVDQIVNGEDAICDAPLENCADHPQQALCLYRDRVDVYEMEAQLSIGPVFARHLGYRMYRGEYYATQSDAHVTYTRGWDEDIIRQFESTRNEMAVLSTYLTDIQGSLSEAGDSLRTTRPIMCNTVYEGGVQGMHLRHASQPERRPAIIGVPQLQPWWAAGYSFSRGHFLVNVPYDYLQPMIFQGEEMSIGIRGYTVGYDFYAPERSVCFHHYAVGKNLAVRSKVHHFWENDRKYAGTGRAGK
jgi:[Skp1-protein]-hydroxyproline N-acetylglucosaminyltransferase